MSYVDKLLKPIGGNMEDVVPIYGIKDCGIMEEVPKESLSIMDYKLDGPVIPLSNTKLLR